MITNVIIDQMIIYHKVIVTTMTIAYRPLLCLFFCVFVVPSILNRMHWLHNCIEFCFQSHALPCTATSWASKGGKQIGRTVWKNNEKLSNPYKLSECLFFKPKPSQALSLEHFKLKINIGLFALAFTLTWCCWPALKIKKTATFKAVDRSGYK